VGKTSKGGALLASEKLIYSNRKILQPSKLSLRFWPRFSAMKNHPCFFGLYLNWNSLHSAPLACY
jgi:hypothetical protein